MTLILPQRKTTSKKPSLITVNVNINPLMHNIPKWSDTPQKQPPEVFYKKGVLKFRKIHKRTREKEVLAQVFSCEFYQIFENTFFTEHLRATAPYNSYHFGTLCIKKIKLALKRLAPTRQRHIVQFNNKEMHHTKKT